MGKKNHLELLCDAGEMFALLSGVSDTEKILQRCVLLVARHLDAEVCSIYLLDSRRRELVLRATKGLNPESVGVVKMRVGEGLVGKAMDTMEMILEDHASLNPDFKYFPGANEEPFECFLAIPILRGWQGIGVMVVQRLANHSFSGEEAMVLRSIASQLAVIIENARVLLSLKESESAKDGSAGKIKHVKEPVDLPRILPARIASRGIAVGRAMIAGNNPVLEMLRGNHQVKDDSPPGIRDHGVHGVSDNSLQGLNDQDKDNRSQAVNNLEKEYRLNQINALEMAIERTASQIESLEKDVSRRLPEAVSLIFGAHIMILNDKGFSVKMKEMTRNGGSALSAVVTVARKYMDLFGSSDNEYLQAKVADVEDIAIRLIENLHKGDIGGITSHENRILIARDLLPSQAVRFAMKGAAGFILAGGGGIASHAAILARSLGIPMLITDDLAILSMQGEPTVVIDAEVGNIYFNPDPKIEEQFHQRIVSEKVLDNIPEIQTLSADGVPVSLMVNINLLSELDSAIRLNAPGVGLYRSEFPFLVRNNFPSEAEQIRVYDILFSRMAGKEVTVRTLDVGGDKMLSYFENAGEANPELGLRSIRFAFRHPEIMEQQIRAILVASADAEPDTNLRIMFPMISSLDDFRKARDMVASCYEKLKASCERSNSSEAGQDSIPKNKTVVKMPQTGMMIELPSVVEIIDALAAEADFFSIGTNDFVQYMLAADRTNDRIAEYYAPHHPGVLRALNRVAKAVIAAGKDISVCGEMARESQFIPFFLGIGIRKLSVNQHFLFTAQKCINRWSIPDAQKYAQSLLAQDSVKGVERLMEISSD
ncbi:MAG: phosphoenolpyruvate--protein phosphotransferase [Desulfamplus sp.]|nr:phosphoenolpyruvate--protein phosphotransferase [Desulfamplus sp.]